jgi:hypothetical protein
MPGAYQPFCDLSGQRHIVAMHVSDALAGAAVMTACCCFHNSQYESAAGSSYRCTTRSFIPELSSNTWQVHRAGHILRQQGGCC